MTRWLLFHWKCCNDIGGRAAVARSLDTVAPDDQGTGLADQPEQPVTVILTLFPESSDIRT